MVLYRNYPTGADGDERSNCIVFESPIVGGDWAYTSTARLPYLCSNSTGSLMVYINTVQKEASTSGISMPEVNAIERGGDRC